MRKFLMSAVMGTGLAVSAATGAGAEVISNWLNITNNGNSNVGSQLSVEVTAVGTDKVLFKFMNNVGIASSITDIYFDDGTMPVLATPMGLVGSTGVSFSQNATPPNLPGANGAVPPFNTTIGLSADSNPPVSANGINAASEWLELTLNLVSGKSFADVIADLNSGDLRIGMHIQSIGTTRGSDSYVNGRPSFGPPIPAPAAIAVFGVALAGLGLALRRRQDA